MYNENGYATRIIATGEQMVSQWRDADDPSEIVSNEYVVWAYCHMPHDGDPEECADEVRQQLGWHVDYPAYIYDSWVEYSEHSNKMLVLTLVQE